MIAALLASCTATGTPDLEIASPGYVAPAAMADDASAMAPSAELAAPSDPGTVVVDGKSVVVPEVAIVPASRPHLPAEQPAVAKTVPGSADAAVADAVAAPGTQTAVAAAPDAPEAAPVDTAAASAGAVQPTAFAPPAPKKRGFLASLFATPNAETAVPAAQAAVTAKPRLVLETKPTPAPLIQLASTGPSSAETPARASASGGMLGASDLPGVRQGSLFEISRKSGLDDTSDVDLHEDEESPVQLASAAGLARLAPNGLLKQRESVDVACLKPALVRMLKSVERHYGRKMVVTSGYRSPSHNRRVRGARNSMHMYCAAADVQVPGVSKWELARFVRAMPGRGGVGTYCHTESVHIDVGPERDWNWRCRRRQ